MVNKAPIKFHQQAEDINDLLAGDLLDDGDLYLNLLYPNDEDDDDNDEVDTSNQTPARDRSRGRKRMRETPSPLTRRLRERTTEPGYYRRLNSGK